MLRALWAEPRTIKFPLGWDRVPGWPEWWKGHGTGGAALGPEDGLLAFREQGVSATRVGFSGSVGLGKGLAQSQPPTPRMSAGAVGGGAVAAPEGL